MKIFVSKILPPLFLSFLSINIYAQEITDEDISIYEKRVERHIRIWQKLTPKYIKRLPKSRQN